MNKLILAMAVLPFAVFCVSCGNDPPAPAELNKHVIPISSPHADAPVKPEPECRACDLELTDYEGVLTKEEVHALLLALNDEHLAFATYGRINRDFNDPRPFSNIQKAEGRHIERLESLFAKYELPIPKNTWLDDVPRFKSLTDACKAGIEGEIANRDLYTRLFESTERQDIVTVYQELQSASEENHLPALERCLTRQIP